MADGLEELELNNVMRILEEYCKTFRDLYKQKLTDDNKKATGKLINSVQTEINFSGTELTVVLNVEDYYKWVEEGRKPGKFPPIANIKQWVKDKPIIPRPDSKGKLPTENQLAFLIGRKIEKQGIKPGYQLKSTIDELNSIYIERLKNALEEDFNAYQVKILKQIDEFVKT